MIENYITIEGQRIEKTDRDIDGMIYALYGLTEEEVKIIEDTNR